MKSIKNLKEKFIEFINENSISWEYKIIYMMALYSIPSIFFFAIIFTVGKVEKSLTIVILSTLVLLIAYTYRLYRFDKVKKIRHLLVVVTNFLMIPLVYVFTGDIYNGAPLFFVVGIVITFFIIIEKSAYIYAFFQMMLYMLILYLTYSNYDAFEKYRLITPPGLGIVFTFVGAFLVPGLVIAFQSINYQKMAKELKESNMIIEEAKANKSRFLANMTHEIRTPMNAIVGMNELILRENLDAESKELAESIKDSSNQLLTTINNILEFSRVESNKIELFQEKYDFKELITNIVESVAGEYAAEDIEFDVNIDPSIPRILFGDSRRIKQVFSYILFSTLHMISHTRISLRVEGDIDGASNTVLLSVSINESGRGLSKGEIDAMLSAYTKFDSRQKSDFKKTGMEFAICSEILEMMGSSLKMESIEDVGIAISFQFVNYIIDDYAVAKVSSSKDYNVLVYCANSYSSDIWRDILEQFNIYPIFVDGPNAFKSAIEERKYTHIFIDDIFYPLLKDTINAMEITNCVYIVTQPGSIISDFGECKLVRKPLTCINIADAINYNWNAKNYELSAQKETVIFPQAKVLIVDDSVVNLRVLDGMLSTFKIKAKSCKSGKKALEILERELFDLLIIDQRMPEMDGVELLGFVKNLDNSNAIIPAICATADFGPDVEKRLKSEGFLDYIAKPVKRHYLERALRNLLPSELAENIKETELYDEDKADNKPKNKSTKQIVEDKKESIDPQKIDFSVGLANVGGIEAAFNEVVSAFYKEGLDKLEKVPGMYKDNLSLYVIDVHALKSSCAAIGAAGLSLLFKELEFNGRAGNVEFLASNDQNAFNEFEKVLVQIKDYLIEKGVLSDKPQVAENMGELSELSADMIDEVIEALAKFNLKLCEDKLKELAATNFGSDNNMMIASILDSYEKFDYHKVKDDLNELKAKLQ